MEVVGLGPAARAVVRGVESFRRRLKEGQPGDSVGCLLEGLLPHEVARGQVLSEPGSVIPHERFLAEVYVLKREEGGRHTPFFDGYRPQFCFGTHRRHRGGAAVGRQRHGAPGGLLTYWRWCSEHRSLWTRMPGSPSARAGAPWARAWSQT